MSDINNNRPVTFQFRNIGPIKDAELELGELTIIAGRNNTGKSYIVYTLYGFLKTWSELPLLWILQDSKPPHEYGFPNWDRLSKQLTENGRATFALDNKTLGRQREWIIPILTQGFSEQTLSEVFSSQHSAFENASLEIACDAQTFSPRESMKAAFARGLSFSFQYDGNEVVVTSDEMPRRFPSDVLSVQLAQHYVYFLLEALFPKPFVLSAERFGISLFYRELDFTKNQLVDLLQKMADDKNRDRVSPYVIIDKAASRYALPIKDNIDYTRSIPERREEKSEFQTDKLFNNIKDMMDGYYRASGDDLRFISKARGKERSFNIRTLRPLQPAGCPISISSCDMPGQLLIIDEPESHLDTANQIFWRAFWHSSCAPES